MKILLVDDHTLVRDALRDVLKELAEGTVVLEAMCVAETIRNIEEHPDVDLILLDLMLPDGQGLATLSDLRHRFPDIPIAVLSALQDRATMRKSLEFGAFGFIPKSASRLATLGALRLILSGNVYVPPEVLMDKPPKVPVIGSRRRPESQERPSPRELGITERKIQVLALILEGKSNKTISHVLELAQTSVKTYVSEILKSLNVRNRTEAAFRVRELGWKLPNLSEAKDDRAQQPAVD
jgi:DNA-binding NarL/FixJ family response regulator